eukprot:6358209-Amphidinium_carterae.1
MHVLGGMNQLWVTFVEKIALVQKLLSYTTAYDIKIAGIMTLFIQNYFPMFYPATECFCSQLKSYGGLFILCRYSF